MILKIHLRNPGERAISKASDTLKAGGIVIYPTDTVYGLGCSIEDKSAIERIYLVKGQGTDKPFSFVCSSLSHISEYAHVSNAAFGIIKRLIPGPYTFILPATKMKHLPKILVSRKKTVGIRVPASPVALALVEALGHPVLSTSVTLQSGEVVNDPDIISDHYNDRVDLILDGGILVSQPSTVLDLTGEEPRIIRQGAGNMPMA